jgi:hypothetical protein
VRLARHGFEAAFIDADVRDQMLDRFDASFAGAR